MNKHTWIGHIWTIFHICFLWKGEDFHLDRELYLACRKDREAVCSEVRLSYVVVVQLEYLIENYECASFLLLSWPPLLRIIMLSRCKLVKAECTIASRSTRTRFQDVKSQSFGLVFKKRFYILWIGKNICPGFWRLQGAAEQKTGLDHFQENPNK